MGEVRAENYASDPESPSSVTYAGRIGGENLVVTEGPPGTVTFRSTGGMIFTEDSDCVASGESAVCRIVHPGILYVWGGQGNDVLRLGSTFGYWAEVMGGDGDDTIVGGPDNDVLSGGAGADIVRGGAGYDIVSGFADRAAPELTFGEIDGSDRLFGDGDPDALHALGGGLDTLDCGGGDDYALADADDGVTGCETRRDSQ